MQQRKSIWAKFLIQDIWDMDKLDPLQNFNHGGQGSLFYLSELVKMYLVSYNGKEYYALNVWSRGKQLVLSSF